MKAGRTKALILGLGRFGGGQQAARYLLRHGWALRISDRSSDAELREAVDGLRGSGDVEPCLGREDIGLLRDVNLVVVNPAVPPENPVLQEALRRGMEVTQEACLFLDHYPGRVVLVTGTNGKSTTSNLLAAALAGNGFDVLLGGNIGHSLLAEEERWRPDQIAVLEISSFQLERLDPERQAVEGAVITRVGQDHLDRHGDITAYRAAKAVAAAAAVRFTVHAGDDPVAAGFASGAQHRAVFGTHEAAGVSCERGWVRTSLGADPGLLFHHRALTMLGDFQLENAMAAAAAAMLLGASRGATALALVTSKPLPYRLQLLREMDGVRLYDNSVSTELESTALALRAVPGPVHWVGGGKSKDDDYPRVVEAVAPYLASAHLFGSAAGALAPLLRERIPVTRNERLTEALKAAWTAARRGHAVVMSPAFASFDQYANFRARAEEFHLWARQLQEPKESSQAGTDWPSACEPLN